MPEPIQVPNDTAPRLSTAHIVGSPLTTVGGFLAGFAAYLLTNGDQGIPDTWQGWLGLILGAVIAGAGALMRGTTVKRSGAVAGEIIWLLSSLAAFLLCLAMLVGCKGQTPPTPTSTEDLAITTLITGAAHVACAFGVPGNDRPAVTAGLVAFLALLNTDPATAMRHVEDPADPINQNLGMGYVWASLHSWLSTLGTNGWDVYGPRLMRTAVTVCIQAINTAG